jgi:chorismate dehydratase
MIRLGDIEYRNCYPVHARLIEEGPPAGVELVRGSPGELNGRLAAGEIDVAPCSSIEYARHAAEDRLLPGLAIASDGAVGSILFETTVDVEALGGARVALPTASATSVVLLRGLLEERWKIKPEYGWYDQRNDADPVAEGARAALRIGDVALRRSVPEGRRVIDLGEAWTEWTGLPFVYALWQARWRADQANEMDALHDILLSSHAWFRENAEELAERKSRHFDLEPARLLAYWRSLEYVLDERLERGMLAFYDLAVRLGEAPAVPELRWLEAARSNDGSG